MAKKSLVIPDTVGVIVVDVNHLQVPGQLVGRDVQVRLGAGPVLRVGDKSSVFTPEVTAFCDRVAKDMLVRTYRRKHIRSTTALQRC